MGQSRDRKYNYASEKEWWQDMIQGKNCFLEWNNKGHSQIQKVERDYQMTLVDNDKVRIQRTEVFPKPHLANDFTYTCDSVKRLYINNKFALSFMS